MGSYLGYEWSSSLIPPLSIYFPVEIPGQYLHMLAGRIALTCTFIDSMALKCERFYTCEGKFLVMNIMSR